MGGGLREIGDGLQMLFFFASGSLVRSQFASALTEHHLHLMDFGCPWRKEMAVPVRMAAGNQNEIQSFSCVCTERATVNLKGNSFHQARHTRFSLERVKSYMHIGGGVLSNMVSKHKSQSKT